MYISKNFVAYIKVLVCTAPYFKTTTDARNKLDACFAKAFKELDRQEDQPERFNQYVVRKLRAWFTMFPPTSLAGVGGIAAAAVMQ